jgi:hypothetical protein
VVTVGGGATLSAWEMARWVSVSRVGCCAPLRAGEGEPGAAGRAHRPAAARSSWSGARPRGPAAAPASTAARGRGRAVPAGGRPGAGPGWSPGLRRRVRPPAGSGRPARRLRPTGRVGGRQQELAVQPGLRGELGAVQHQPAARGLADQAARCGVVAQRALGAGVPVARLAVLAVALGGGGLGARPGDAGQLGLDPGHLLVPPGHVGLLGVWQTTNRRAASPWPRRTCLTRRLSRTRW